MIDHKGRPHSMFRLRKKASMRSREGLIAHARDHTSQNGEDGVIERLFSLLPKSENPTCVDIGAWDGVHLSNTYSLLVGRNGPTSTPASAVAEVGSNQQAVLWKGLLVEADPQRCAKMKELHEPLGNKCICSCVKCEEGHEDSLPNLLERNKEVLQGHVDFISIDVDGCDYWLMFDLLSRKEESKLFHPRVICVEFNPTIPDDVIYVQPRDDCVRHGSSLAALVELAEQHSYVLCETTLFNAFFVKRSLHEQHLINEVPDTRIEVLHEMTMGTSLFQLYDGTIKLHGCKKLLWHRQRLNEEDFQVLRSKDRSFPFAPGQTSEQGGRNSIESRAKKSAALRSNLLEVAVDISPFARANSAPSSSSPNHEDSKERSQCTDTLWRCLSEDGFAYIRGTGVPPSVCRRALSATESFFAAPREVKLSARSQDRARRGYSPNGAENFASLVGESAPNDLVAKFRVGNSRHGKNSWPSGEQWGFSVAADFRNAVEAYYAELERVGRCVLEVIVAGLRKEKIEGSEECARLLLHSNGSRIADGGEGIKANKGNEGGNTASILTLLGYGRGDNGKIMKSLKRKGKGKKPRLHQRPLIAAHTDVGVVTILLEDGGDCAVLERASYDKNQIEWVPLRLPEPDQLMQDPVFIVNIGDCLSDLSHGALKSTLHRVSMAHGSRPRHSLGMFVGFPPDVPLPLQREVNSTEHAGEFSHASLLTYREWRKARVARSMKALKESRAQISK